MPVEEVHIPAKVTNIDPNNSKKTNTYWETQATEARQRREYLQEQRLGLQEQRMADEIINPAPQEPPFKVTGGINLGNFDLQEQQRRAEEKAELERKEATTQIAAERAKREEAENRARNIEIEMLKSQFAQQMDTLQKMIQQGLRQPKSFTEQYDEAMTVANKLGLAHPQTTGNDPRMQLEMMKLQADMAREEREFKQSQRNDDKKWQLELAKLDIEKKNHAEQLQHQKERNEMFANAFKTLGGAIAAGLTVSAEESEVTDKAPVSGKAKNAPKTNSLKIQAALGRTGSIECPNCHGEIGIGPNSTTATCAGCGFTCPIKRVTSPEEPEEEEEEEQ